MTVRKVAKEAMWEGRIVQSEIAALKIKTLGLQGLTDGKVVSIPVGSDD